MATIQRILLRDLAARLGCELRGDPNLEITGVAGMEQAGPTELTFLANPKYAPKLHHTHDTLIDPRTLATFHTLAPGDLSMAAV